ncbi:MAG: MarR family winged helix-turn-helix transcriptional regulator [Casimicrobium sp.]
MTTAKKQPASSLFAPSGLPDLVLYRVSQMLAVAGAPITRLCEGRFGITRREWRLIALLAKVDCMSSSELAEVAQLDRARTSRSLTALETKKLVKRHTIAGDARRVSVQLTASGQALFAALWPLAVRHHRLLLESLSEKQIATLDQVLTTLRARADELFASYDLPLADRRHGGSRSVAKR